MTDITVGQELLYKFAPAFPKTSPKHTYRKWSAADECPSVRRQTDVWDNNQHLHSCTHVTARVEPRAVSPETQGMVF